MILNQLKNTHQANGCCGHCKREKKNFYTKANNTMEENSTAGPKDKQISKRKNQINVLKDKHTKLYGGHKTSWKNL